MQHPTDGAARDQQEEISYEIQANIDEAVELAILSSKQLFEGILVDLDPIDRDKLINKFLPSNPSFESMMDCMQKILEEMTKNSGAARHNPVLLDKVVRNTKDLTSALANLKELLNSELENEDSPQRCAELQNAMQTLENILRSDIISSLKLAMGDANDDNIDDLLKSIAKMSNALDRLRRLFSGEEDFDLLNGTVNKLQDALQKLRSAMEKGDKQELLSTTKDTVEKMKAQHGTLDEISPSLIQLVQGAKIAIDNPSNNSILKRALEDFDAKTFSISSPSFNQPSSQFINSIHNLQVHSGKLIDAIESKSFSDDDINDMEANIRNSLDKIHKTSQYFIDNYPSPILSRCLHELDEITENLIKEKNNLPNAKDQQAKQREKSIELINSILKSESDSGDIDSLIENVSFLNHMLNKLKEALKNGDLLNSQKNSKISENILEKENLLVEMIAKNRMQNSPNVASELIQSNKLLIDMKQQIPILTNEISDDITKFHKITPMIAKIREFNEGILNQILSEHDIGDKLSNLNIDIDLDVDKMDENIQTRNEAENENLLTQIAENIENQKFLSNCLISKIPKDSQAKKRQENIQKALQGVDGTLNRLKTAAADAMNSGADRVAKNRLKKALNDISVKSEELTAAGQDSLIHRILSNGNHLQSDCNDILNSKNNENLCIEKIKDGKAVKRFEKQIALCNQMANQCNDPQLKLITRKLVQFGDQALNECKQTIKMTNNLNQIIPHIDRIRQVNEKLLVAAQRAENCSQNYEITNLADAARRMNDASELLLVDDSPKGQLNEIAQKIAIEMKKMSDSAIEKNKRGMITSAKTISQLVMNIVKIASSIPCDAANKRFRNEMLSTAHAAQNFSVVSKIFTD